MIFNETISGKTAEVSAQSHRRDGREGRPLPFSCTSTISSTLRESKLLPPFTRGQRSAERRPRYQRRAIGGTVAKVGHCLSRAQAPLVLPFVKTLIDFLRSCFYFLCWRHSACLSGCPIVTEITSSQGIIIHHWFVPDVPLCFPLYLLSTERLAGGF